MRTALSATLLVASLAVAAGTVRFVSPDYARQLRPNFWFSVVGWMLIVPGAIGAAIGCLAIGWRRAWQPALWGPVIVVLVFLAMELTAFLSGRRAQVPNAPATAAPHSHRHSPR